MVSGKGEKYVILHLPGMLFLPTLPSLTHTILYGCNLLCHFFKTVFFFSPDPSLVPLSESFKLFFYNMYHSLKLYISLCDYLMPATPLVDSLSLREAGTTCSKNVPEYRYKHLLNK